MKKRLSFLFALSYLAMNSQVIEIGKEASYIKQIVEYKVKSYYEAKGDHSVQMATDTKYSNGKINDVFLCYSNQYRTDFRLTVSYCEHYIMTNERLSFMITQYEQISIEQLEKLYNSAYGDYKIESYYFDKDFNHYQTIYLANNNYATSEWRKTNEDDLPVNIKNGITKKINDKKNSENQKQFEKEKEKEKQIAHENKIKSKTYDIKELTDELNKGMYSRLIGEQIWKIKENAKEYYGKINEDYLNTLANKIYRSKNKYSAYYKLIENEMIVSYHQFQLIEGTDTACDFISRCEIKIPTVYIENVQAMTELSINDIVVDLVKGIAEIKVKSGNIEYRKNEPPIDIKEIIEKELLLMEPGKYKIQYQYLNVMGEKAVIIKKI